MRGCYEREWAMGAQRRLIPLAAPNEIQVELPQFRTHEEGYYPPDGHEDPERQRVSAPHLPGYHENSSGDRSAKSPEEYRERRVRSEEGPEHPTHFDVPHTHASGIGKGKREEPA